MPFMNKNHKLLNIIANNSWVTVCDKNVGLVSLLIQRGNIFKNIVKAWVGAFNVNSLPELLDILGLHETGPEALHFGDISHQAHHVTQQFFFVGEFGKTGQKQLHALPLKETLTIYSSFIWKQIWIT